MQPFKPDLPAGWTALHLPETDSTMSALRRQPASDAPFELFTADFQTAGHGQRGTVWEAERGQNLLFSFRFHPQFLPAARQFALSEALSLAIVRALRPLGVEATVKWPNDIYWRDKKICGMLIENDLTGHSLYCSVIGIGININQREFLSDALNPVSLVQITGREYDREEILNSFLKRLYDRYLSLLQEKEEEIRSAYMAALYRGNGFHPYRDEQGVFQACILGIEPTGHLILKTDNGEVRRYAFKEVSVVNT